MKKDILVLVLISMVLPTILYFFICWTDGNLEYVLSYFKERHIEVPFWMSAIIAIVGNGATLLFNIICELAQL